MNGRKNISLNLYLAWLCGLAFFIMQALIPSVAFSNDEVIMKGYTVLWPAEIDGWKIAEGPTPYDPATAYKYMNGAAELFIAFNMRTLTVVRYEKLGQPAITLEIYQMASSGDAYGIFSFESDDPKGSIGQGSEFGGGLLRFWKGSYFVSVYGDKPGAAVESATLHLGGLVASAIMETGEIPKILAFLPERLTQYAKKQAWFLRSHILLNQRFFIAYENIFHLAGDGEVALGQYVSGNDKIHLLIIKYPLQNRADEALRSFKRVYMADAASEISVRTENKKWTAIEKYGPYLTVIFDAPDELSAMQMLKLSSERLKEGK
jgi:hypothetical protein